MTAFEWFSLGSRFNIMSVYWWLMHNSLGTDKWLLSLAMLSHNYISLIYETHFSTQIRQNQAACLLWRISDTHSAVVQPLHSSYRCPWLKSPCHYQNWSASIAYCISWLEIYRSCWSTIPQHAMPNLLSPRSCFISMNRNNYQHQ